MKTDELRKSFLEFFKSKGHEIVPSDSLVPGDDPTLLFTGAGMNQFKEKFLGRNITYKRVASSQKCIRTGDLRYVGKTAGHHTFFEMLGNFSFGDYFKKDAILWAWELLTQNLKLKSQNLWVSVYKDDGEAYNVWKDVIKVPEDKIMKFGAKENFWPSEAPAKGPNGPCGPCSEIFYDWGKRAGCGRPDCTPACNCGRFVEVWNLVFTQFDRQSDGTLKPLPSKNIDTGMGLERLASVMQGVKTNFEIDIFQPIIEEITVSCKLKAESSPASHLQKPGRAKINAIADHVRAVTFAICDGVMPSNEERGYVVRKLIRQALIHANDIGIQEPFLYKLVGAVAEVMKGPYPEIKARRDDIAQVVKREEENFLFVIDTQLPKVEGIFEKFGKQQTADGSTSSPSLESSRATSRDSRQAAGLAEIAFSFYDTYGMPYEMLEEAAEKFRLKIDKAAFDSLLEKQRELSRAKSKIRGEIFSETFAKRIESLGLKTEFLGYERSRSKAKVMAVLEGGEVILDKTPFYGESGGQAGDWGKIQTKSGVMEVEDAKKIGDTIVHIGRMIKGNISKGETAKVEIDEDTRIAIMKNHTATHLLQAALRKVLGDHVRQTGSLVDKDHLRFDFTHMKKMNEREIGRAEEIVSENIKRAIPVKKEIEDIDAAKSEGATALFGEKYDRLVRVVSIGDVSKELCGGTHVDNTKDIDLFRITSESSIASGVRRIEAMTGAAAREWMKRQEEAQKQKLKAQSEMKRVEKELEKRFNEEIERIDSFIDRAKRFGETMVVCETVEDVDIGILRDLSDRIKAKAKSAVIILATKDKGKVSFIISMTEDVVKNRKLNAGGLAKELAGSLGGSGGGRPDFAQGGGKDISRLKDALKTIEERLR